MATTTQTNLTSVRSGLICPNLPLSISGVEYNPTTPARVLKTLVCVFNCLTSPSAVLANLLVFVAILRKRRLRSVHNTSLLCLALADLLVALVAQPCFVSFQAKTLLIGRVPCSADLAIYAFAELLCTGLSFLTLTLITVERYVAIFYPYAYVEQATRKRILVAVGATWLVWISYASVVRFTPSINSDFYTIVPGLLITANFIATVFVYARVTKLTRRNHVHFVSSHQPRHADRSETRRSKTIAFISIALLCCFTPVFTVSIMHRVGLLSDHVAYHVIYPVAESAVFFNSLLNPLIYAWRDQCMRTSLVELLRAGNGGES